ncbi:MAG: hypothetical protein AAGI68_07550 [Planctomycetota bacterium]
MTFTLPPDRHRTPAAALPNHAPPPLESRISELWQQSAPTPPPTATRTDPTAEPPIAPEDLPAASQLLPRLLRLLAEHPNRPTSSFRPVVRRMIIDAVFCCDAGDPADTRSTDAHTERLTDRLLNQLDAARRAQDPIITSAATELRRG